MLDMVIDARKASISTAIEVRRILPFRKKRMVGPFIFMDHAGPVELAAPSIPEMDVLPHPHIGLSTVTYLFNGEVMHRDSLGVEQVIKPGAVNWMTAGSGISHSERFENPAALAGTSLEMLQTWVALPEKFEEIDPMFSNYQPDQLPEYDDKGIWMRLIAGNAYGLKNDVKTHSPLFYLHVKLDKDTMFGLPRGHTERAIYIAQGTLEISGRKYQRGQMLVFGKDNDPGIRAYEDSVIMMLGGEPLGERYIWWNFVSSRKERIEQAKADWQAGRIKLPPTDDQEFVQLPLDRSRPSDPPSPQALS
ncbi:pirin family protein [Fulvivirga sediminis]|uniref:Pirin family protein n=1 Tax=Fulvivirga sediminis TaxID=2803949 RepID=A0A937K0S7_9BACT|nr:pirin family protein [Fulvivirga sediminis]MBL3657909.1 pirin family protein [Fulvivirga sediminis]